MGELDVAVNKLLSRATLDVIGEGDLAALIWSIFVVL